MVRLPEVRGVCGGVSLLSCPLSQQLGNYLGQQQRTLTSARLTLYCVQICKALAYLEGLNMVHRYFTCTAERVRPVTPP